MIQRHAVRRRNQSRILRGFTLIEVLLVLIILVVIGSLVATNVFSMKEQADLNAARVQIRLIKTAMNSYLLNMNKYPASLDDLYEKPSDAELAEKWGTKPYLEEKLPLDPWSNEYQYASPGEHNTDGYDFWSNGPDGESGTDDDIGNWSRE
jgi:general secretion pathway protein G